MTDAVVDKTWPTFKAFTLLKTEQKRAILRAKVDENTQKMSAFTEIMEWYDNLVSRFTWAMEHIRYLTDNELLRIRGSTQSSYYNSFTDLSIQSCDTLNTMLDGCRDVLTLVKGLTIDDDRRLDDQYQDAVDPVHVNPNAIKFFASENVSGIYKTCVDELMVYAARTCDEDHERFRDMAKQFQKKTHKMTRETIGKIMQQHAPPELEMIKKEVARVMIEKSNLQVIIGELIGIEARLVEMQGALVFA